MMRVAEKQMHASRPDPIGYQLYTQGNNAGAGVEYKMMPSDLDLHAGGVSAESQSIVLGGRITSPDAPKPHPKGRWLRDVAHDSIIREQQY